MEKKARGSFWGWALILVGLLFLAGNIFEDSLGDLMGTWWPVVLILFGLRFTFTSQGWFTGVILLFLGVGFLLRNLGYADIIKFEYIIPGLLVLLGLQLVLRHRFKAPSGNPRKLTVSRGDEVTAVFGKDSRVFEGDLTGPHKITAVFGEVSADFSRCTLAETGANLEITAAFGQATVRIPRGWRVELNSNAVLGSVDDKRESREPDQATAGVLRVEASGIFGSVELLN